MKQKFINGFLVVALFFVAMGSFVSCKDTDEDAIADLRGELQNQNATLKQLLEAQVKGLQDQINSLESAKQACQTECNAIKDRLTAVENKLKGQNYLTKEEADKYYVQIEAYTTKISELETAITTLTGTVNTLKTTTENAISNLQADDRKLAGLINDLDIVAKQAAADVKAALALAQANEVKITNIQNTIAEFNNLIVAWTPQLQQLIADAAQAKADAAAALLKANTLEQLLNQHIANCSGSTVDLTELNNKITALRTDVSSLQSKVAALEAKSSLTEDQVKALAQTVADNAIAALRGGYTGTLKDLEDAYKAAVKTVQDELDALELVVADNQAAIASLNKSLQALVTGIIVQGTVNPMIGYMNLPLDMRSTMLAAYCGEAGADAVIFPSINPYDYMSDSQTFTTAEIALVFGSVQNFAKKRLEISQANGRIYDFEPGNKEQGAYAGTLYVTINPNTVNFENQVLTLENSIAEQSAMYLTPLKPSDYKLTFGWTRAADNGFYEAKAYVKEADINKVAARIDLGALKDVAKDVLDYKNGVDLTQMATTIYSTFSNVLDANAVKASYESYVYDAEGNVESKKTNSIYSNYNLALTTIKPLSYKFSTDGLPLGILSRRFATIGNLTVEFDTDCNVNINVSGDTKVTVKGTVHIPAQTTTDGLGNTITIDAQDVPFESEADLKNILQDYADDIAGSMDAEVEKLVNSMQDQVNGKINDYVSKGNNVIKKVNKVLDRVENFVKNIDSKLQPVMMFVDGNSNYHRLNDAYLVPTKLKLSGSGQSAATLVATSYTAELIAPACKKMVVVTNVLRYEGGVLKSASAGDDKCKEALNYANSNGGSLIGNVVSGSVRDFPFVTKADYADYIFEVSYFALDFSGKQSRTKYYIQPVR